MKDIALGSGEHLRKIYIFGVGSGTITMGARKLPCSLGCSVKLIFGRRS